MCKFLDCSCYNHKKVFKINKQLNLAFQTSNSVYNQLCNRTPQNKINSGGAYKLQCKTSDKSYVGLAGRSIEIRHHEHIRYIKTNHTSAYTFHIHNNRHTYCNLEYTMRLLKTCNKGKSMNCWESFNVHMLQQLNLFINKQKTNEPNPLYALANITKHVTETNTYSESLRTRPAQE
jgi:hypothetical protein